MRIYILGVDGYLGWPLMQHLHMLGHVVGGCDNMFRRHAAQSLIPLTRHSRIDNFNINHCEKLKAVIRNFAPDTIVHLAEIPSAPYSMRNCDTAQITQSNNILGTLSVLYAIKDICPGVHLVKLGSMGEYIPSSWYHLSKIHDSANIKWACENWKLRVTDIMQGPVYGVGGRFDYDEAWGTVINRWVCMGLSSAPILVYGHGEQVRGFLPIHDSLACFTIVCNNPARTGEYRVINQYAAKYSLNNLAEIIASITGSMIEHIKNPRQEKDAYEGDSGNGWLVSHGYKPSTDAEVVIGELIEGVKPFKEKIEPARFMPSIYW